MPLPTAEDLRIQIDSLRNIEAKIDEFRAGYREAGFEDADLVGASVYMKQVLYKVNDARQRLLFMESKNHGKST